SPHYLQAYLGPYLPEPTFELKAHHLNSRASQGVGLVLQYLLFPKTPNARDDMNHKAMDQIFHGSCGNRTHNSQAFPFIKSFHRSFEPSMTNRPTLHEFSFEKTSSFSSLGECFSPFFLFVFGSAVPGWRRRASDESKQMADHEHLTFATTKDEESPKTQMPREHRSNMQRSESEHDGTAYPIHQLNNNLHTNTITVPTAPGSLVCSFIFIKHAQRRAKVILPSANPSQVPDSPFPETFKPLGGSWGPGLADSAPSGHPWHYPSPTLPFLAPIFFRVGIEISCRVSPGYSDINLNLREDEFSPGRGNTSFFGLPSSLRITIFQGLSTYLRTSVSFLSYNFLLITFPIPYGLRRRETSGCRMERDGKPEGEKAEGVEGVEICADASRPPSTTGFPSFLCPTSPPNRIRIESVRRRADETKEIRPGVALEAAPGRASANSDLLPLPVTFRDSAAASLQVYRIATSYCQDLAAAPAAAPAAKRHATASAISLYEPRAKSGAFSNHCVHKFVPSAPAARSLRHIIRRCRMENRRLFIRGLEEHHEMMEKRRGPLPLSSVELSLLISGPRILEAGNILGTASFGNEGPSSILSLSGPADRDSNSEFREQRTTSNCVRSQRLKHKPLTAKYVFAARFSRTEDILYDTGTSTIRCRYFKLGNPVL
ncbi:unnamed protein product, partial [Nesidiocoris tenuis]